MAQPLEQWAFLVEKCLPAVCQRDLKQQSKHVFILEPKKENLRSSKLKSMADGGGRAAGKGREVKKAGRPHRTGRSEEQPRVGGL